MKNEVKKVEFSIMASDHAKCMTEIDETDMRRYTNHWAPPLLLKDINRLYKH